MKLQMRNESSTNDGIENVCIFVLMNPYAVAGYVPIILLCWQYLLPLVQLTKPPPP